MPAITRPIRYRRLAARLAELDISRKDAAAAAGIHPPRLTEILRGALEPTPEIRSRLAALLDVDEVELFAVEDVAA